MDTVVQLLENLQFWNPEQTEVGESHVDVLCAPRDLEDGSGNTEVPQQAIKKKTDLTVATNEFGLDRKSFTYI